MKQIDSFHSGVKRQLPTVKSSICLSENNSEQANSIVLQMTPTHHLSANQNIFGHSKFNKTPISDHQSGTSEDFT